MRKADYLKIFEELRKEIDEGVRVAGDALPTERELSERHSCSRPTVRKALSALEDAGLIQRRPGVGSTVANPRTEKKPEKQLVVGIDFTNAGNGYYYYDLLIEGLNEILSQHNGMLRLLRGEDVFKLGKEELDGLVIVKSNELSDDYENYVALREKGVPVAMINRFPANAGLGFISVNYMQETRRIVARMLANGARRVAVAGGDESIYVNCERMKGWRQAYADAGAPAPEEISYNFNAQNCDFEGFAEKLRTGLIDAIFVLQATLLSKTCELIYKSGAKDTPIICFDDVESFCELSELPISYVKMPLKRMGRIAAEHFAALRKNPELPPPRLQLPASLVVKNCKYLL